MFACFNIFVCMWIAIINILLMCLTLTLKFLWSTSQKSQKFVIHCILYFGHYITYIGEARQIVEFLKRCFSLEGSCTVVSVVSFAEKTFCCENIKTFDVTINIKCTPQSHSLFNHKHSPIKFPPFVKVFSPLMRICFVLTLFSNWFPNGLTTFSSAVSFVII